jgi:pimeloyl-ACP methyl ester carboxylesterase
MEYLKKKFGKMPIAVAGVLAENRKEAKEIIFIHMSWGGAWAFSFYMKFFARVGYNCYVLDLRGHGESGGTVEGATMQDYVDDVRTAVQGLGLRNPIVVGHSMGGLIALMYSARYGSSATVSLDGSPSLEAQKTSEEKTYPAIYAPKDAGMPANPIKAMMALSDIYPWRLMKMKRKLGVESGVARSQRKRGISVPKEKLTSPLLFIGAEKGASLPFGIGIEKARAQAGYYGASVVEIKGATHPGLLIGRHWKECAQAILKWLKENNL